MRNGESLSRQPGLARNKHAAAPAAGEYPGRLQMLSENPRPAVVEQCLDAVLSNIARNGVRAYEQVAVG